MKTEEALKEFTDAGALLRGHFILTSGLHSDTYFNKLLVLKDPVRTTRLCSALAEKVLAQTGEVDYVISPAMGAVIFGYETARRLGCSFMFLERAKDGFRFRNGTAPEPGARVLVVEDVLSTGLSAREAVAAVRSAGGNVLALGCLVDRSAGKADTGVPVISLAALDVRAWSPACLPAFLENIPAVKPGSRERGR